MRALLASLTAAALLAGTCGPSLAQSVPCMRTAEKAAFDLAGLKSQLMVIAIDCQAEDKYNSFVVRFRPDLQSSEKGLNTYFSRTAKGSMARAHDDYITSLANAQSQTALTRGTLFCDEHLATFDKVLAVKDGRELVSFASGQSFTQPIDVVECPTPPPPAPKKVKAAAKTASAKPDTSKTVSTQ
jgi:hypothetical protein